MVELDNYKKKSEKSEKKHEIVDFSDKKEIDKMIADHRRSIVPPIVDTIKRFDVSSSDIKFDDAMQHARKIDSEQDVDVIIRNLPSNTDMYKYAIGNVCSNPECNVIGDSIELHHIRPVSEGGLDRYDNFIMLCHDCHMNGTGMFDLHNNWQHNYEQLHEWKKSIELAVARQYSINFDVSPDELIRKIINAKNAASAKNRPDIRDLYEYEISDKFNTWGDYQADIVDKIVNSEKKYFVLRAPPGSGKSLIAIVAGLELRLKTFYVVHNKQLQHQIINDFSFIHEIKGRDNFICKASPCGDSCSPGYNCGRGKYKTCEYSSSCDYKSQYNIASESNFVCWNYAYFLQIMNYGDILSYGGRKKFDPDLIILDEAHLIDSALSSHVKFDISEKKLNKYGIHFPLDCGDAKEWLQYVLHEASEKYDEYNCIAETLNNSENIDKDAIHDNNKHIKALQTIINKAYNVVKYSNTKWIVDEYSEVEPISGSITFESHDKVRHLAFSPVWTDELSNLLLGHASKYILMSATISNMDLNNLGIKDDDIEFIDMPSTFNPKRMPIKYMPYKSHVRKKVRYINKDTIKDMMSDGTIIDRIDSIIEHNIDHKGVIHTVNYQITEHILSKSMYSDRMISHLKDGDLLGEYDASVLSNRDDAIKEFIDSDEPKILVSPSVETGLDLPGDLGRWQIIAKIPYANIGDKVVGIRIKDNEDWYIQDAINKAVQATGRICRSISDYGTTYILDANIKRLLLKYHDMFPEWWLNSLSKNLKEKYKVGIVNAHE